MGAWVKTLENGAARIGAYVHLHWKGALRLRERFSISDDAWHIILASGVGVIGGLINLLFYTSVEKVQELLTGQSIHNAVEVADLLNRPSRLLTPALGGLGAGLVLFWGFRFAGRQQRSTNLLEVVVAGDGRLPLRSGIIRFISSMISIGTGASIGREGSITQLSASVASRWGQWRGWQPYRLRLMVACGAAAGIAATYNAPITGAVFAAHIVLGNFSMNLFAPLLCSSVIASMLSRSFFGVTQWYEVPPVEFTHIGQLPWFVVLGILSGVLGAAFLKLLKSSDEFFKKIPVLYVRMLVGGLLVGGIAVMYPEVWGNGYRFTNKIIGTPWTVEGLSEIFLAKLLATVITVGAGAVGGVFTPTLFLGAGLGALVGMTLQHLGLSPAPIGIFALTGMGCVLSATTRSPLLAIIMIFEISLNYSLMPALMLGCAVSSLVSRRLHPHSIYTEPLRLRSLELDSFRLEKATDQTIGHLMRPAVPPVIETMTLPEIADRFLRSQNNFLPVVDAKQQLVGIVALQDLKAHLGAGQELSAVIASEVMRAIPPFLTPGQKLLDALPILLASEQRNVPVVESVENKLLIGSVPRSEALAALSEAIAANTTTIASAESIAKETHTHPEPLPAAR